MIDLRYGSGSLTFDVPEGSVGEVVRPPSGGDAAGADALLAEAVAAELQTAQADCAGRRVLVLLADGTRDQPHRAGYAALAPLLSEAGSVDVLLATGTHSADTPDNRCILDDVAQVSAERAIPLASAAAHDCRTAAFFDAGTTAAGSGVRLNRLVAAAETIFIVSDTKPHYFAGYSNPTKFLLPGVAAFDCIESNHAFALDPAASHCRHPLHPDRERRRNPVAEEQLEVARWIAARKPVYALVTAGAAGQVNWAAFGPLERAVADGIRFVDVHLVVKLPRRYRRAVISCGGYPDDETLYIAQRSLELAKEVLAPGAEVVWLAECRNGIASSQQAVDSFFTPLKTDPAAYVEQVRRAYVMHAHKTVKFVDLMETLGALHVVSDLPAGTFPAAGIVGCSDPRAVVARWASGGEKILFVDGANRLALTCGGSERPVARDA